jgi:8-oxo-dGTP diphosphatase
MPRARAIIVRDRAVALIERRRDGLLYYVFPGGGLEHDETPETAALREVREELGLLAEIDRLVAQFRRDGDLQFFFLATITGGAFSAGGIRAALANAVADRSGRPDDARLDLTRAAT